MILGALVLFVGYFLVLPQFWPEPEIEIRMDTVSPKVIVHSWHTNITLFSVDGVFEVNPDLNSGTAVFAVSLLPKRDLKTWSGPHTFGISRLTWLRSIPFQLALPMETLTGKIDSDLLRGTIRVRVRYADPAPQGFMETGETTRVEKISLSVPI